MSYSASAEQIEVPEFEEDSEEAYYGPFNADEFYDDEYEDESTALIGKTSGE